MRTHSTMKKLLLSLLVAGSVGVLPEELVLTAVPAGPVVEWLSPTAEAYYGTSRRVSRRTSRRTSARQNAMYSGSYAPGYGGFVIASLPMGAHYVNSLPSNCTQVVDGDTMYQQCGSSTYRPYYQGTEVVYVQE